ncbi:MAG TPA: hypothetical protein PK733_08815 [Clostridiales bacterium]|nr:hypothetical protein [Clostridiales bacterium]
MSYLKARKISKITSLTEASCISIFTPKDDEASDIIEDLIKAFQKETRVDVFTNPDSTELYNVRNPIILIGNLSNSFCVEAMYYRYLLVTDLTYPGIGGFEARTLLDPLATGYNIIHLGYSDISGLKKAVEALIKNISKDYIEYMCEINPTQLPMPQSRVESICADKIDFTDQTFYYTALQLEDKGYIGYLTGDSQQLEEFNIAFEMLLDAPLDHLKLFKRCIIWRLLEVTGMLRDDLHEQSINFFYNWADSKEGIGSFSSQMYQSPYFPRQNHGLMPAFGVYLLANYFEMYYPDLEHPAIWKETAKRVFAPYENGNWKPLCDGLCHGWWMSQPPMLDYALFDDAHAYFISGGAEKAGLCAMSVINNEGWMPCAGDASPIRNFPHYTLDINAAYFKDGRYRFISELAPLWRRAYNYPTLDILRRFDIGVEPIEPTELLDIIITPMDPLVYNAWKYEPEIAKKAADTPPTYPIEKCFDKIAIRTGFKLEDDYLLIDGLGGGSHSYADAMAILDYEVFGISFIVGEDAIGLSDPTNENTITIYRDGYTAPVPAFPAIEEAKKIGGNYYVKLKSGNYNGAIWERDYYLVPAAGLIIQDKVTAETKGMYAIESHYRCPGIAELKKDCNVSKLHSKRRNINGDIVNFEISTISNVELDYTVREMSFTEYRYRNYPGSKLPINKEVDGVHYLKERYHLEDNELYLNSYDAKTCISLEAGDSVVFTSLAFPTKTNTKAFLDMTGKYVILDIDGNRIETPLKAHNVFAAAQVENNVDCRMPVNVFTSNITYSGICSEGSLLCGLQDGRLMNISSAGIICAATLDDEINAAEYNGEFYVVSHGKASISLLDKTGISKWTIEVKRIPTLYPWWELNYPTAVRLLIGKYKGQDAIIAGCGDDHVHFYSLKGEPLGTFYHKITGVPDMIEFYDVNQDGQYEILITSSMLTCTSVVDIINTEGESLHRFGGEGWKSNSTCIRCFNIEDKVYIAHGIYQKCNLELRVFDKTGPNELIEGRYIIKEHVAGAVAGFAVLPEVDVIAAGTSQGFVIAYNFAGERIWFNGIKGALCDTIEYKNKILAADLGGYVYILSPEGAIVDKLKSGIKKPKFYLAGEELFAVGENRVVRLDF